VNLVEFKTLKFIKKNNRKKPITFEYNYTTILRANKEHNKNKIVEVPYLERVGSDDSIVEAL
jgi:hypothetical protein